MYVGDRFNGRSWSAIKRRLHLDSLARKLRKIDMYLDAIDRIDDFGGGGFVKSISKAAGKAKKFVSKKANELSKSAGKKFKQAKKFASKKINQAEKAIKKNPKAAAGIAAGTGAAAGAGATALAMKKGARDSWYQDIDWWKGNIGGQLWESTVNKVRGRGFKTNEEHLQSQINEMQKMNSATKPQPPAAPKPATPAPKAATPKPAAQPKQPAQPKPAGPKPPSPQKATDSWYRGYKDVGKLLKCLKGR